MQSEFIVGRPRSVWRLSGTLGRLEELWVLLGTTEKLPVGVAVAIRGSSASEELSSPTKNQRFLLSNPLLLADTGIFVASGETALGK